MIQFSVNNIIENIRQAKKELVITKLFQEDTDKLDLYIEHMRKPLFIMVMGEFSTGKSTFINALVGKQIAVVGALPTTAVITKLCYGDAEKVTVFNRDGSCREYEPDEWERLTAESNDEANTFHEEIDYVERALPIPVLKDMTVIDSPGLNALKEAHTEATKRFVEQADTVLWMISSEKAATDTEYQGIEKLTPRLKPIVIVNKMDLLDEEEGDDPESFLQNICVKLKDKVQAVIGISAEYAFQGKIEGNEALLAESNFSAFDDIVRDVILPNRDAYKVNSLIDELNEWLYDILLKLKAAEEKNKPNEEKDYKKYVENRSVLSRVEDALALIAQPLKDYCQESTNNASALALLGILHEFGLVLVQHESQAMYAYEKAAVKNNSFAQYVLAKKYVEKKIYDKAEFWLNKAIEAEYPLAGYLLHEIEQKKNEIIEKKKIVEKKQDVIKQKSLKKSNETDKSETTTKKYNMSAVVGIFLVLIIGIFIILTSGNNKTKNDSQSPTVQSISATSDANSDRKNKLEANSQGSKDDSESTVVPIGVHWLSDANGVFLWNPEPGNNESITWSGGYVTDGKYKFADGRGTVTWYSGGKIIQVDEGSFSHGRHHGKFIHKFPSGKVIYSNWDHGRELR
ncbi:hypothetical protein NZ47_03275 [Anaerovibrio lipolyticus]|uniref:Dynamin N-terminal domain-containing protein n=1 Tax=Anaerovibrio lipolyticus TaxID=82374 RepID=A0A0B2K3K5_9FIRM|nr:dynamin family protein [Anaerovibrio lipolyticus]KHM52697.1 hypothetical protein NZ47_03275 [Anaerovibrio lipolyticus]